jgi:hypothetical protein
MKRIALLIMMIIQICLLLYSEGNELVIYATKDAALRSLKPNNNYSGKTEAERNYGFGIKSYIQGGAVTYPVMTLESTSSSFIPKNSFLLGGFDISPVFNQVYILGNTITSVKLRFFINYSTVDRNEVCVYVRRVLKDWDENTVTYNHVYSKLGQNVDFTDLIDGNDNNACFGTTDVRSNSQDSLQTLPCPNAPGFWEIDITKIFNIWMEDPGKNFGLLVDPLWYTSSDYTCKSLINMKANIGDIHIATTEWENWNGEVPGTFSGSWLNVNNTACGTTTYVPQIIVTFEREIMDEGMIGEGDYSEEYYDSPPSEGMEMGIDMEIVEGLNDFADGLKEKNIDKILRYVGQEVKIDFLGLVETKSREQFADWMWDNWSDSGECLEGEIYQGYDITIAFEAMYIMYQSYKYSFNYDGSKIQLDMVSFSPF